MSKKKFLCEQLILILLLCLTIIGIELSHEARQDSLTYWLIMDFIFWIASLLTTLLHAKEQKHPVKPILIEQTLHWFAVLVAIMAVLIILEENQFDLTRSGLAILLILGLGTFLDGIRIGLNFKLIGVFLGVAAVVKTNTPESYIAIVAILAIMIVVTTSFSYKNRSKRIL